MEMCNVILCTSGPMQCFIFSKDFTNQAFFAVYDGHSGVDASNYAASHLHCYLAKNKNIGTDPKLALKEAFVKVDESFVVKAKREVRTTHSSAREVTCLHGSKEFYLLLLSKPCILSDFIILC